MIPKTRHKDIFPPGFDKKLGGPKRLASASAYIFQSEQLYSSIVNMCNPTSLADTVIVTSAWYGKRTKSKLAHEFLLFEVKDTANEGFINYMILDRNAHLTPSLTTRTRSQSCSTAGRADDQFRVAYDGNLSKLLLECSFKSHQLLEKLGFSTEIPFYFYELVTLANAVSQLYPEYSVVDSNCYLYAGLVWECMLQTYPDASYETDMSGRRGRFGCIRYTPDQEAKQSVYREFQDKLSSARTQIERARQLRERFEAVQGDDE